ncbi:putative metal-nicotianamine transporter YSL17 [Dichanthelium oligosanthes]|uniref:Putative metal-nicotianamine transporter YSL17 n=1 Tax=Dichanthelium oligosanthes TaxID=888268 RepID=A0A1E5UML4_9POAL|nr:putative metal-nicotianamine transporter YSL17 [Dichanthelium oligosanthes]
MYATVAPPLQPPAAAMKTAKLTRPPPFQCLSATERTIQSFDDRQQMQVFLRDRIPSRIAVTAYTALATASTAAIPHLYPQLRYHIVALAYLVTPVFAFCNAYGVRVTDMNLSTTYGKIAMLVVSSWVGTECGGVVAGLVTCGAIAAAVSSASEFMQDFKTGYLTLTSQRTVLVGQVIGTALGRVVNPVIFWVFYRVYNMGILDVADAPYAKVYRGIVMLSTGRHGLPQHSLLQCKLFFGQVLVLSAAREATEQRQWGALPYIPSTIGVAVAFFVPPKMPVGMAVGSLALYLWKRADHSGARMLSTMASGLICGDGLGSLMLSMLMFFKAQAPICIKFFSQPVNAELDAYLAAHPMS